MAAGDLTTLAKAKAWAGVTGTSDDALLTDLVTRASTFIQTLLNRTIAAASYSETRDGTGGTRLSFANTPVTAVASLSIDGVAIPLSTGPAVAGYVFSPTQIMLRGYSFTRGFQNAAIAYTAGYASVPADIEQACCELVALRYKERDRIGHSSKSLAGETVTFYIKDLSPTAATVISNYRKVVPA